MSDPSDSSNNYYKPLQWDSVHWGTHCVDCYPGNCPMRVYVKDGKIVREEPCGTMPSINDEVPDYNPMGCMQGSCWNLSLEGPDRSMYPLRRSGERGEGKWQRISWDDALTEIADLMIEAIEEHGPRSIVREGTPEAIVAGPTGRFYEVLGGFQLDLNAIIGDVNTGVYITYGKAHLESSADDWFHSDLLLFWNSNPVYTRIPFYHFLSEARYNGAEVVNISPDINPSHTHADYQITLEGASDAAFGLSLVQVMFAEDIAHLEFIREQTDLSLLVRSDTRRYLRQSDLQEGGLEQQLYQWHPHKGLCQADRGNLKLDGAAVALTGSFEVSLADGGLVEVQPVCALLRQQLDQHFTPELAQAVTGVHPDTIRMLARKIATSRTNIIHGMNACKMYHGDLIERAMCLVLAISGNWGKKGTGLRTWGTGLNDGAMLAMAKRKPGAQAAEQVMVNRDNAIEQLKKVDPTLTTELAMSEFTKGRRGIMGLFSTDDGEEVPQGTNSAPVFWWYYQAEYGERWNNPKWSDPTMPRSFDEYMQEALDKGWWDGLDHPRKDEVPQVLIECGGNTLRRSRGGKKALEKLWSKLNLIVAIDFKMTLTAQHADYFLPAAQHYEKMAFAIPGPYVANLTLADKIVPPAGESKTEWELFQALLNKIAERASEQGLQSYQDPTGHVRKYGELINAYTMDGYYRDQETLVDEEIRDSALAGTLPEGMTLEKMRETGFVRFIDMGMMPLALGQATTLEPNDVITPLRNHTEKGFPFPTYSRRAQFYIDHPWFLEADEALPTHKPNPAMGGDYPLGMTSGHNRWSVHSMNHFNEVVLGTHRGSPSVMISSKDAVDRKVSDDDMIRVCNDVSEFLARAKVAANVKPGQIISYNGWEPMQYKNWSGANEIEPGMVKWNGLSGGYGHLNYSPLCWQPVPVDRWVRCDFELAE